MEPKMAAITLKNNPIGICNRLWKMGKIGLSGSKLKIIDILGQAIKAWIMDSQALIFQIIEFSDLALFGRFRMVLTLKFH